MKDYINYTSHYVELVMLPGTTFVLCYNVSKATMLW